MMEQRRARGRTVIVIAHDLDLVAEADHVIVLRDGTVVEQGAPADLVGRRGAYQMLLESRSAPRVA
jgi:putative ABC transport system ATP-binding protein/ATP-binding cassette subfamily B protein